MNASVKDRRTQKIDNPMWNRPKRTAKQKSEYELLCEAAVELKQVISVLRRNADQLAAKIDEIQQERRMDARED